MKKGILFIFILFLAMFMIGCGGETPEVPDEPNKPDEPDKPVVEEKKEFTVGEDSLTLELGEEKTLTITKDGDFTLTLVSSDDSVATVDQNGKVKALKAGTCKITISVEDNKKEVNVTVNTPVLTLTGKNKMTATESQKLEYTITSKLVETINWESSDTSIATVDDKGNVKALKGGSVVITATAMTSNVSHSITIEVEEVKVDPESVELTINCENVYLDSELKVIAKVLPEGASQEVTFSCPAANRATIDEEGNVTILKSGKFNVICASKENPNIKATISINVFDYIDPEKFINSIHIANPLTEVVTAWGWGAIMASAGLNQVDYKQALAGSVSKILWTKLVVNEHIAPEGNNNRPGTKKQNYFVTVHDTATTHSHAHAQFNANSVYQGGDTSWHYSVGRYKVWHQIPDDEVAWHAGDGTATALTWTDTGVKATSDEDAKITISSDGYWEVNGTKTELKAPEVPIQHYSSSEGWVTTGYRQSRTSDLPYTGINNIVGENGNVFMGNVWWSTSYQTLSNRGGNNNSIGIETCVNYGTDLHLTWATTAKLIGTRLLPLNGLNPEDVKQHNTFSGKDCPMTLRKANLWEYFMELVIAEFTLYTQFKDFTFTFTSNNPDIIGESGQIIKFPEVETEVTYSIQVTKKDGTYDKTFTFKSVVPAMIKDHALSDGTDLYFYMQRRNDQI